MARNQKGIVFLPILIIIVLLGAVGYFVYKNYLGKKQSSESFTFCQQDSDCILVYPFGNSVSSCCWGCQTFSININDKGRYDELFNQKCKEIECPPYAPGAACFPHKAVCANNECQAERIIDDYSMVEENEIDICEQNSDCTIVPYDHCCGSTKRAINKKYETLYFTKPSWQKFIGPCHLMGICPNDSKVTEATCENYDDNQMKCKLKY